MPMIEVKNLTKRYGSHLAVDNITFAVEKGEIVGFLGRNGAGKTTTMRVLTGSLGATEGRTFVGGIDVFEQPGTAKRIIGYLPEQPPLYTDLTVRQYLWYAARLKRVASPKEAVERVIELVALKDVAHRLIEHLSKGYKQRVGIAQALIHSPQVLILDEPVSGLDPAQRADVIALIKKLAEGAVTVVLSTHVLAEVEPVIDRAIIIHRGRIVAQDTLERLADAGRAMVIKVARPDNLLVGRIQKVDGVSLVDDKGDGRFIVESTRDVREDVARAAVDAGLLEMTAQYGLQDVFLRLTGEA